MAISNQELMVLDEPSSDINIWNKEEPDEIPEYIVGIGASAGGLEALESLFASMPLQSGMAYIIVQHLSPDYKSMMDQLLARKTMIPIKVAEDQMIILANTIYLLPPKKEMIAANGKLLLTDRDSSDSVNLPINTFFRSLADTYEDKSIAIILSGTGSDGSNSVTFIHDNGGFVIAQSPESCKFDSMPENAISTGNVDLVARPQDIPNALIKYTQRTNKMVEHLSVGEIDEEVGVYSEILILLNKKFQLDFSQYKPSTITRRLERRLSYQKSDSLRDYIDVLLVDEEELEALYFDLLIGVTKFFRDPNAFEFLSTQIPTLLERFEADAEIRIWIAACSTGQEAYSIAMMMVDMMGKSPYGKKPLKIFATDVHSKSIQIASAGIYEEEDLGKLDKTFKERFFTRLETGKYQVIPEIRKSILFVQQNLLKDPPFTRTHIVTCRNVLIYFNAKTQERVLSLFTFSLLNKGILFLGPSETMGSHTTDYVPIDERYRIFKKTREIQRSMGIPLTIQPKLGSVASPMEGNPASSLKDTTYQKATELLLQKYVPPSVLINDNGDILHIFGDAGDYLSINFGTPSLNIKSLVSGQAKSVILQMVRRIIKTRKPSKTQGVSGLKNSLATDIEVRLLSESANNNNYIAISFTESLKLNDVKNLIPSDSTFSSDVVQEIHSIDTNERIKELEEHLQSTQEDLQSTVEELETSNEELQATNEELMSSNEELQSTNEELQSVNEELFTVNNEFQVKLLESNELISDERSIVEDFNMGILFLDEHLRVRKFSIAAAKLFNLIDSDLKRPISTISNLMINAITDDIRTVFNSGTCIEKEVSDVDDTFYHLKISLHEASSDAAFVGSKTNEEGSFGVAVSFTNITKYRAPAIALKNTLKRLQATLDAVADGYFEWTYESENTYFPRQFVDQLGYMNELPGLDELLGESAIDFKVMMNRARKEKERIEEVLPFLTKSGKQHWVICKGGLIESDDNKPEKFSGILLDFNAQRQTQNQLNQQATDLERSNELLVQFANIVSHDMRAPLRHIVSYLGYLEDAINNNDQDAMQKELAVIYKCTNSLDALIDDIIMYSRVNSEKKAIASLSINEIIDSVIYTLSSVIEERDIQIKRTKIPLLHGDKSLLTHLFQNLISNACKYNDKEKTHIDISHEVTKTHCLISVKDNGIGFDEAYAVMMFEPFQRLVTKSEYEGTGIGLSICKTVVEQHKGTIEVTSTEGVGSCFTVSLPLNDGATQRGF